MTSGPISKCPPGSSSALKSIRRNVVRCPTPCAAALRYDTVASPLDEWVEEDGYSTSDQVWAFLSKFSRSA